MKIGQQIKFLVINRHASSLYSLIADGRYRPTTLGRNTWKTLIGLRASLQTNCNKEGFNAVGSAQGSSKARIGFLGNNENDCVTPDSRIGFGTGGYHDDSNTCGNEAIDHSSSDNGGKHIKAMGYILVQWWEHCKKPSYQTSFKQTTARLIRHYGNIFFNISDGTAFLLQPENDSS